MIFDSNSNSNSKKKKKKQKGRGPQPTKTSSNNNKTRTMTIANANNQQQPQKAKAPYPEAWARSRPRPSPPQFVSKTPSHHRIAPRSRLLGSKPPVRSWFNFAAAEDPGNGERTWQRGVGWCGVRGPLPGACGSKGWCGCCGGWVEGKPPLPLHCGRSSSPCVLLAKNSLLFASSGATRKGSEIAAGANDMRLQPCHSSFTFA